MEGAVFEGPLVERSANEKMVVVGTVKKFEVY